MQILNFEVLTWKHPRSYVQSLRVSRMYDSSGAFNSHLMLSCYLQSESKVAYLTPNDIEHHLPKF